MHDGPERRQDVGANHRLEQVPPGAGLHQAQHAVLAVVAGEDQDFEVGVPAQQLPGELEPVHARHDGLGDDDVRVVLGDERKSLEAVAGLGDDLDVGLRVEQRPDPLPLDRVIVDEQDADLSCAFHRSPLGRSQEAGSPPRRPYFIRVDGRADTLGHNGHPGSWGACKGTVRTPISPCASIHMNETARQCGSSLAA